MFDIPNKDGLWVFNSPSTWQTWVKPNQYNNFMIYVCGAGGGGGSGSFSGVNTSGNAGGGGGGGALVVANIPSFLLPENLYINIGSGGNGGATSGAVGTTGGTTYLCYYPNTNAANILFSPAGGAGAGATAAAGAGGSYTIPQTIFSATSTNGGAGSTGGYAANSFIPVNISYTTSVIFGGAGGAGKGTGGAEYQGGSIIGSNIFPTLNGGTVTGGAGLSGYLIKKPFTSIGGTGGGSNNNNSSPGGKGGSGYWGAGGGGGGCGTNVASGMNGGKGGDGFVIIIGY